MGILATCVSDLAVSYVVVAATILLISKFDPSVADWRSWDSDKWTSLATMLGFELLHYGFSLRLFYFWEKGRQERISKAPDAEIVNDVTAATTKHISDSASLVASPLDPTRLPLLKPDRHYLNRPTVAWPTVLLALAAVGGWLWMLKAASTGTINSTSALLGCVFFTFVAFTPMHDAVHNAVCPRDLWLNDLVGTIASVPFLGIFRVFKVIHLMHHRHCNDQDSAPDGSSMDPDNWAGEGPVWQLPLRWASVFLYYRIYIRKLSLWEGDHVSGVSKAKYNSLATQIAVQVPVVAVLSWWMGPEVSALMMASLMIASSYLMYVFDYLPHRPHKIPYRKDPYMSTSVVVALFDGFLTIPLLCQNMHNIHHLYPYIPFYRYGAIWHKYQAELVAKGTRVVPWLILGSREQYFEELKGTPEHAAAKTSKAKPQQARTGG